MQDFHQWIYSITGWTEMARTHHTSQWNFRAFTAFVIFIFLTFTT